MTILSKSHQDFFAVAMTFQGRYMKDFLNFSTETTAPPPVGNWFALTILLAALEGEAIMLLHGLWSKLGFPEDTVKNVI